MMDVCDKAGEVVVDEKCRDKTVAVLPECQPEPGDGNGGGNNNPRHDMPAAENPSALIQKPEAEDDPGCQNYRNGAFA